jgi:hypothetical protein
MVDNSQQFEPMFMVDNSQQFEPNDFQLFSHKFFAITK